MNEIMKMISNIAFSYAKEKKANLLSLTVEHKEQGNIYYEYGEARFDTLEGEIEIIIRNDGTFERI